MALRMCEILAVAAPSRLRLEEIFAWGQAVEHYGIAGFGWGVAWVSRDGGIHVYRNPISLAEDEAGRTKLARESSTRVLLHLRRPNRLSTVQLSDTQPFLDEAGRFAFVHNGRFERDGRYRESYRALLHGKADSEVGFCLLASMLDVSGPSNALTEVHRLLSGSANLGYLSSAGELVVYGGNRANAFYRFRLGYLSVASTALHSDDNSLFDLVFSEAAERDLIGPEPISLQPHP